MRSINDCIFTGIVTQNDEDWKTNRKFFMQILKDRVSLSVKDMLSGSLYDSVNRTIDELRHKMGQKVNIVDVLVDKCNANMRLTLFGETGITEDQVKEINELYVAVMYCFTSSNLLLVGNVAR